MVLTNFECWAHGGAVIGSDGLPVNSRHMDMFNPRMVQQRLNSAAAAPNGTSAVSHISSNGYYGFSYVNAAHVPTDNNNTDSSNNNAALTQNINNNNTCVPNTNDVNGMPAMMHNGMDVGVAAVGAAGTTVFGTGLHTTQRCKKRYFVSDDDYANCTLLNGCDGGVAAAGGLDVFASKRCRFDDDYTAAQYCNDFFSLPSTQIGTQSCLMDTEDVQQQQQQPAESQPQVDVNMMGVAANFNNQTNNTTTSNIHYTITQEQQQQQLQQHQQQVINTTNYQQQNVAAQAPPVVVYQPQHNYQGHLHRANRDVSRCLLSHMI